MARFLFLLFLPSALTASGIGAAEAPRVWVVAIGVGKYDQQFAPLSYAPNGAAKVAKALADARPLVTKTTVLTTDSADRSLLPTRTNVAREVNRLAEKAKPEDLVIVYFCGHGVESGGQQYLLMTDADLGSRDTIESSTIGLGWLREKLEALPCEGRLLILDACRETPESLRLAGSASESATLTRDFLVSGGGWQTRPGRVSATLFGCREGQKVYYGKSGSFFTEKLLEGISGKAADKSGQVTLKSLSDYVGRVVPEAVSEELGPKPKQDPILMPDAVAEVVLRPSPGYIACLAFEGEYGALFAESVQTRLAASGDLLLVERSRLADALKELKLQDTAITDQKTACQLGKLLNAKYILVGSSRPGPDKKLHVNTRLVVVETGENVPGVAARCAAEPSDWEPALDTLGCEILNRMRGSVRPEDRPELKPAMSSRYGEPPTDARKGDVWVNPIDGSELVYVPAGEFLMGSQEKEGATNIDNDEQPQHRVYLDAHWIGKYEVTVAQYRVFCSTTHRKMPEAPDWGWMEDHPMLNVSWLDAQAYAKWAMARLPTEAEWEKAARGTDARRYPWGSSWRPGACNNDETGPDRTTPVGSHPAGVSPYGCHDMAGNAWEWCGDYYREDYYAVSPSRNPKGPVSGDGRVLRGGCWRIGESRYRYRCAARYVSGEGRYSGDTGDDSGENDMWLGYVGFRIAR